MSRPDQNELAAIEVEESDLLWVGFGRSATRRDR